MATGNEKTVSWPLEDLVGVAEIAEELGVVRGAVGNWKTRYPDVFPKPVVTLRMGRVYSREQVMTFHRRYVVGRG